MGLEFGFPYELMDVTGEENGALNAGQDEWSYGNGATGRIGKKLPSFGPGQGNQWELYGMTAQIDTFGNGSSVSIICRNMTNNSNIAGSTITITGPTNNAVGELDLWNNPIPVGINPIIGFRTVSVSGSANDGRVTAFLRRRINEQ